MMQQNMPPRLLPTGTRSPRRNARFVIPYALLWLFAAVCLFPLLFMLLGSFLSPHQVQSAYGGIRSNGDYAVFRLIPTNPTLTQYYQALLRTPNFLRGFWNSVLLTLPILAGTLLVSLPAGYAFAHFTFPLKRPLFFLYILVILLPVQVTLVPSFLILSHMGILGSRWAVILPSLFSPFGAFLLCQFLRKVPKETLESARLDGAGEIRVLLSIILPQAAPAIASLCILTIIDSWNMIEQPLIFLNNALIRPLSVQLSLINTQQITIAFVCGVVFVLPMLLLYRIFEQYLLSGIAHTVIKERRTN